ncbi:hypothetical protein HanHA300_Chr03g0102931 [Helianthus annuus]|nr:hypothetical protein HanHA300_Chr03g0102931 [Helianthus annuus]KAJ0608954.1 hypothetical protein HanHA89_Chr03g0114611 [Helianthus annuus]
MSTCGRCRVLGRYNKMGCIIFFFGWGYACRTCNNGNGYVSSFKWYNLGHILDLNTALLGNQTKKVNKRLDFEALSSIIWVIVVLPSTFDFENKKDKNKPNPFSVNYGGSNF